MKVLLCVTLTLAVPSVADAHEAPHVSKPAEKSATGLVVKVNEGEVLRKTSRGAEIIKVPPEASSQLGLATTEFKARGMRITTHLHEGDDEAFFVHRGGGTFLLGDRRIEIGQGDIVFIPKGVWHGFESSSENTLLVWAVSSSKYLELHRRFFLDTADPGPAEIERLYRLYGFREKASE